MKKNYKSGPDFSVLGFPLVKWQGWGGEGTVFTLPTTEIFINFEIMKVK